MSNAVASLEVADAQTPEPTVILSIELPVSIAAKLKARTDGKLDAAETIALIVQLYHDAPLDRRPVALSKAEFGRICESLGYSPQSNEELVEGVENLVTLSVAGVKVKANAQDLETLKARNAGELPAKEWAQSVFDQSFRAWIDGRV